MKVGMYNLQRKEYMHTLVGVVEVKRLIFCDRHFQLGIDSITSVGGELEAFYNFW
jgi:hypothetical protein